MTVIIPTLLSDSDKDDLKGIHTAISDVAIKKSIVSQQSTIPRSHSLDNSYFKHEKKYLIHPSLFPGYFESYDFEEEEVSVGRSYSLNHGDHVTPNFFYYATNKEGYPDMSQASHRSPKLLNEISSATNVHAFVICGGAVLLGSSHSLKLFYLVDPLSAELSLSEDLVRSLCFPPSIHPKEDNTIIWAGTEAGSLIAINTSTEQIINRREVANNAIKFILRHKNTELWTLDNAGNLNIWPVVKGIPFSTTPFSFTTCNNPCTALVAKKSVLWCSAGRSIDKLDTTTNSYAVIVNIDDHVGDICKLVMIPFHATHIYALHHDGHFTCWDTTTGESIAVTVLTTHKMTAVASVGDYMLWAGHQHGLIVIYDTRSEPWSVIKTWKAHTSAIVNIQVDENFATLEQYQTAAVVTLDSVGNIFVWDGLLANDWFDQQMINYTSEYAETTETTVMICSWNVDASKPDALTDWDKEKLHGWLSGMSDPDIIMIGLQEIVDLGSTTMTVKSLLTLGKKVESIQEASDSLTNRYTLWYEYLMSIITKNFGVDSYQMIKTDQLVGLFSCVFVKSSLAPRISHCESTVVKTGFRVMTKGLHGNKGGIATRFLLDDTSLCFVNCHLAAGQSHTLHRNADMDGILNSARFSAINEEQVFRRETDGSNVLDHETCFLSGDLNYRINMPRDQVLDLLSRTNKLESWEMLLHQDQYKKQQIMNRIYNFKEAPILFDPTYKYDKGTDTYDTSEKKRVPAWCDRILYRAPSTLTNIYYKRHEVRTSDHRPISAGFTIPVKHIKPLMRQEVKEKVQKEWTQHLNKLVMEAKVKYVTQYDLCDENEAMARLEKVDYDVEKVVLDLYHDKGSYI